MKPRVLVTGATGFVGGALTARLVTAGHSVVALVRGRDETDAVARCMHSLSRFFGPSPKANAVVAATVRVLVGELDSEEVYERPELASVTHVVHSAACTSFVSEREVWRSNVEGTRSLAEHARRMPNVRRFLHVSTAYCCGDRPNRVVRESDAPREEQGHVNDYTRSKAAAEMLLRSMGWGDRLVVARPSVVIGHTALGVKPSSSLYWYYRAIAALGCGPFALDDRRDVVPVDYVADALEHLLFAERLKFDTYHVSAGETGSQPLGAIAQRLAGASRHRQLAWRKVSASALAELKPEIRRLVRDDREANKLARGLAACAKFGELGVQFFDNTRLLADGFRPAPRFTDYLAACIETTGDATIFDQMIDHA